MDIGSGTGYPSAALSNFAPHAFTIDGIECASIVLESDDFVEVDFSCD